MFLKTRGIIVSEAKSSIIHGGIFMDEEKRYYINQIVKLLEKTEDIKIIKYFFYFIEAKLKAR